MDPHSLGSGKEGILVEWIKVSHLLSHAAIIVDIPFKIIDLDSPVGFHEVKTPRTSRQSVHEGGKVVCPVSQTFLPPDTHFR